MDRNTPCRTNRKFHNGYPKCSIYTTAHVTHTRPTGIFGSFNQPNSKNPISRKRLMHKLNVLIVVEETPETRMNSFATQKTLNADESVLRIKRIRSNFAPSLLRVQFWNSLKLQGIWDCLHFKSQPIPLNLILIFPQFDLSPKKPILTIGYKHRFQNRPQISTVQLIVSCRSV